MCCAVPKLIKLQSSHRRPLNRKLVCRDELSHFGDVRDDHRQKCLVLIFINICVIVVFLAPWFDVSSLDSPTELRSATEGISTIALILGLILAGLVGGVIAIWRKLKVGLSIH